MTRLRLRYPVLLPRLVCACVAALLLTLHATEALRCNTCNHADLKADCFIRYEDCREDYICFIETQHINMQKKDQTVSTLKLYTMGCQHFHLCRDRVTHGPGPYGYGKKQMECCCSDGCTRPDGIGWAPSGAGGTRSLDLCPHLWPNRTASAAPGPRPANFSVAFSLILPSVFVILLIAMAS